MAELTKAQVMDEIRRQLSARVDQAGDYVYPAEVPDGENAPEDVFADVDPDDVTEDAKIQDSGLTSLMCYELETMLDKALGVDPASDAFSQMRRGSTFSDLADVYVRVTADAAA